MAEELVPIQENDYNEFLLQTIVVIEHSRFKDAHHVAATASNTFCEIGELLHENKLHQLGKEFNSVIGAEKMHHFGAELINPKLHQPVGELQLAVNHGIMF